LEKELLCKIATPLDSHNKKRDLVFNWLVGKKFNLICLQETHCVNNDIDRWNSEWKNQHKIYKYEQHNNIKYEQHNNIKYGQQQNIKYGQYNNIIM
jgi:hypothetical protein